MNNSEIKLHQIYRSNEQFHVRFVGDERKEEPYFLHYFFRPDGVWISKTADAPISNEDEFWDDIEQELISEDPDHDEPMTEDRELIYQCGRYTIADGTLHLKWTNSNLEEKKRAWHFRIRNTELLETDFQEVQLKPIS